MGIFAGNYFRKTFHHTFICQDPKQTSAVHMKSSTYNYFLVLYTAPRPAEGLNIFSVILFILKVSRCFDWLTFCP